MGQFFKNAVVLATGATVVAILAPVLAKGLAPTPAPGFAPDDACVGNARLLISAVFQYAQDYDEKLPATDTIAHFQAAVSPYLQNKSAFTCPATHLAFVPNPAIGGHALAEFATPDTTILFQDPQPHADHKSTVAFLDGRVEQGGVEAGDPNQICVNRMAQVAIAMLQYLQDYDEQFPLMDTPQHVQTALLPYAKSAKVFTCPATGEPFEFNTALSYTTLAAIENPSQTIFVQDPVAHKDGIKTIGYVDGHVFHGSLTPGSPTKPASSSNLQQIGLGILQYEQDNDEILPNLHSEAQIEAEVGPYLSNNRRVFVNPLTGRYYQYNLALSSINIANIDAPADTWLAKDATVNPDGSQYTLYADGHVKSSPRTSSANAVGAYLYVPQHISVGADNETRLIWTRDDGNIALSRLSATGEQLNLAGLGLAPGIVTGLATSPSGVTTVLIDGINTASLWTINAHYGLTQKVDAGPYDGWNAIGLSVGADNLPRILWNRYDGTSAIWLASAANEYVSDQRFGSTAASDIASGLAVGTDNSLRLTWDRTATGETRLWTLSSTDALLSQSGFSAHGDWKVKSVVTGSDNNTRILFAGSGGSALVTVSPTQQRLNSIVFPAETGWTPQEVGVGGDGNARILSTNLNGAGRLRIYNNAGAVLSSHDLTPF